MNIFSFGKFLVIYFVLCLTLLKSQLAYGESFGDCMNSLYGVGSLNGIGPEARAAQWRCLNKSKPNLSFENCITFFQKLGGDASVCAGNTVGGTFRDCMSSLYGVGELNGIGPQANEAQMRCLNTFKAKLSFLDCVTSIQRLGGDASICAGNTVGGTFGDCMNSLYGVGELNGNGSRASAAHERCFDAFKVNLIFQDCALFFQKLGGNALVCKTLGTRKLESEQEHAPAEAVQ